MIFIILVVAAFLFVILLLFILPIYILIRATKKKTAMGINIHKATCPQCSKPAPVMRKPANMRQFMSGGWTCPNCATEFDKWGRMVSSKVAK